MPVVVTYSDDDGSIRTRMDDGGGPARRDDEDGGALDGSWRKAGLVRGAAQDGVPPGAKYARMDDPPDARQLMQKTTIIAEPDAYSINAAAKTGTHAIDQGGKDDLHLPIVLPFDPNQKLAGLDRLEFGAELQFFQQAGATKAAGPQINAKPTDLYELRMPWGKAQLITREASDVPVYLSWTTKEGTYKYEYITYQNVPFQASLFTRPTGIKYREIPPPTEAEREK